MEKKQPEKKNKSVKATSAGEQSAGKKEAKVRWFVGNREITEKEAKELAGRTRR